VVSSKAHSLELFYTKCGSGCSRAQGLAVRRQHAAPHPVVGHGQEGVLHGAGRDSVVRHFQVLEAISGNGNLANSPKQTKQHGNQERCAKA
jgi:hypothetical protein